METENTPQEKLPDQNPNSKPKIVVIMGATGSGKSKLAIDLASHFLVEVINADSMQLIDEIWSCNRLPVIVGGTNYYIQKWGQADNLRYDCCFICVDASLPALDQYVNQRVDVMVSTGLLEEVCDIYKSNADYTRGLRQAIGVREFEDFLRYWNSECPQSSARPELFKEKMQHIMNSSGEDQPKLKLREAVEKVKLNTRRLVRRQRRRLSRLQMLFGWNIHFVDVTSCLQCASDNSWTVNVVEPSVNIIKSFLDRTASTGTTKTGDEEMKLAQRDLWSRYVCEACGDKELRGAHEWEQHKQGRSHRKRVSRLRKAGIFSNLT
ncbi:tRNAisopentenyltransferase 2 [Perilla frutescens var. hirtella]|uniref:tRNAisopentenyltransferase 2 n=1 Tax=Perilla frutescens var. hirtella TaxID=608512 RepID=A0AAD4JGC3_PERFH|nr:tRNAisopentenyltransferase 2 [Perilla frutescens var. frutescens]KAH6793597.1 tRNAisopentenyltransferase 2 [Perilla frutescens var. hirtella]KAH6833281.1 tRNAisopentenyltransferase 2 [Perilla frutescens var. hirtella]